MDRSPPPDVPEADARDQERDWDDSDRRERPARPAIPPDAPEADVLDQARPADLDEDDRR